MTNDDDSDNIESLYNDFLEAVESGADTYDFDLDDLLEIHDYANDIADGYVSLMALTQALNRFPDDEEVAERLALYFYMHNENSAVSRQLQKLPADSFIRRLLEIGLNPSASDNGIARRLDALLEGRKAGSLTDEEIIRLFDVVNELGQQSWAINNYGKLKSLAQYPDTLMNETVKLKSDNGSIDESIYQALTDFTTEYPFNSQAWIQLADYYTNVKPDIDLREQAVNFALAIDPNDFQSRAHHFDLLAAQGAPVEQLLPLLESMIADFPDQKEYLIGQKAAYQRYIAQPLESRLTLTKAIADFPRSVLLHDLLIDVSADMEKIALFLRKTFRNMTDEEYFAWHDALERRIRENEYNKAGVIASLLIHRTTSIGDAFKPQYMECLYRSGRYEEAISYYENIGRIEPDKQMFVKFIYLLALKRTGRFDDLRRQLEPESGTEYGSGIQSTSKAESQIVGAGYYLFVRSLMQSLDEPTMPDDAYDPFTA